MTNGEKLIETFPSIGLYKKAHDGIQINFNSVWFNAEYKEPTTERGQEINKSAMMQEIYMQGVNMAGEYQGCWVRFKEIEKIVDRYVR